MMLVTRPSVCSAGMHKPLQAPQPRAGAPCGFPFHNKFQLPACQLLHSRSSNACRATVQPPVASGRANRVYQPSRPRRNRGNRPPPPDLPSILYDQRVVFLGMPMVPAVTELLVAELLHLEKEGPRLPVEMLINSTGTARADGETLALDGEGIALLTTMGFVRTPIETVNIGVAVGWACVVLANGRKGKRKALPHSIAMLQQPRQPPTGQRQAIEVHVKWREVLGFKQELLRALSLGTGWNVEKIDKDIQRALYMSPEDCIAYNVIDEVIEPDYDKLSANEKAWRKSGRLDQRDRVEGFEREMAAAFQEIARVDLRNKIAEELADEEDYAVKSLGIPYKAIVEEALPDDVLDKLEAGKLPFDKLGIEVLKRQSEKARHKVFERRIRASADLTPDQKRKRQIVREAREAESQAAGMPTHEGSGFEVDYKGLFSYIDEAEPADLAKLDLDDLVKKYIKGPRKS